MEKQICSTEMEWGAEIQLTLEEWEQRQYKQKDEKDGWIVPEHPNIKKVIDDLPPPPEDYAMGLRINGEYLSNGGRLYIDHAHAESSLTELDSLDEIVAAEIGSERIILNYFKRARAEKKIRNFILSRRVRGEDSSWGYHENYLVERSVLDIVAAKEGLFSNVRDTSIPEVAYRLEHAKRMEFLGLHLATRNIYAGAGAFLNTNIPERCELRFVIGQKASHLDKDFSEQTTIDKGVVNLRDTPYADKNKWSRLHVTCGDANMSPWATKMKIGTTSLVLDMLRFGIELEEPIQLSEGDLVGLAKHTGEDITCQKPYTFKDGSQRSALDIQRAYLKAAKRVADYRTLTGDQQWVLEQWETALNDIQKDPFLLHDRADWVRRYKLVTNYRQKNAEKPEGRRLSPQELLNTLRRIDQSMDRIWEEEKETDSDIDKAMRKISGMAARQTIWKKWMPSEELIQERRIYPPKHLRGYGRGRLCAELPPSYSKRQDWTTFVTVDGQVIHMIDPTQATTPEIEAILAAY